VPVDDTHFSTFGVTLAHVTGELADQYRARIAAGAAGQARGRAVDVAEAVLRGEVRVQEVDDRRNAINVQDYVSQVGQGAMPDLRTEHLGRSDAGVALLRAIWTRELQAFAAGRPLKAWTQREGVGATSGLVGD
jgi:5,5'-dehydrodivanillate O-demethylase